MQAAWLASVQSTTPPTLPSHMVPGTGWESTPLSMRAPLPRLQSSGKTPLGSPRLRTLRLSCAAVAPGT